jgi:hypothetical protein
MATRAALVMDLSWRWENRTANLHEFASKHEGEAVT